jgi:hypothetical protein
LPSEVLNVGWDIDLRCAELSVAYEAFLHKKHEEGNGVQRQEPTQEEMLAMLEKVRNKNKG